MISEKTPWFSGKVLPVRAGIYEVRDTIKYRQLLFKKVSVSPALNKVIFDGVAWKPWRSYGVLWNMHPHDNEWRGFTTNQDAADSISEILAPEILATAISNCIQEAV